MNSWSRLLVAVFAAAAVVSLAGCSERTATTSGSAVSAATTSTATTSTASSAPSLPEQPGTTGSVGGIEATVDAEDSGPLRPGGDPMSFTVTLTNTTSADIPDVGLVVALGHCSCELSGARMMPSGTMRMRDPDTDELVDAPYVREGTGMDFLGRNFVPPFVLEQGQTVSYELQMQLDPNPDVTAGTSQVNVYVKAAGDSGTAASLPISVEP